MKTVTNSNFWMLRDKHFLIPGPAECAERLNPPHPTGVHLRVELCWDSQYSLGIRPHETPTGRQHAAEPSLFRPNFRFPSAGPRLFSLFFAFLASLSGFLGPLGPLLGPLLLDLVICIDFLALRG